MDRREFLQATFAASAATVALGPMVAAPSAVDRRIEETGAGRPLPQMIAQQREVIRQQGNGTTDLSIIAQHLLLKIAARLEAQDFFTVLAEGLVDTERHPSLRANGQSIGHSVLAYEPGIERFSGPQQVVFK